MASCVVAVLVLPTTAQSKKQHGGANATGAAGSPAGGRAAGAAPPNQMDFFQGLSLGSNKEPIHIASDALELDYKASVLTYSGNVKVTQGDVTLTSDRLAITYDREAVQRSPGPDTTPRPAGDAVKASGSGGSKPGAAPSTAVTPAAPSAAGTPAPLGGGADKIKEVIAEGHVHIQRGDRVAEGRRAVFDQAKQTITLTDNAVLHEGQNQVAGERIIVYLQEQRSVVESGSNSRVSAVFYPNAGASGGPTPAATPHAAAAASVAVASAMPGLTPATAPSGAAAGRH